MSDTIFYSWQSDRSNRVCRSFIEDAVQRAIKALCRNILVEQDPRLDRDTRGVPGSPDITNSIENKIDSARAMIADVTIVTPLVRDAGRLSPNPNVATEVGYGLRSLGDGRLILVVNEAFGTRDQLPFDLRNRRIIGYTLEDPEGGAPDSEWCSRRSEVRQNLSGVLAEQLRQIFSSEGDTPPPTLAEQLQRIPRQFRCFRACVAGSSPPEYRRWTEVQGVDGRWRAKNKPDEEVRDSVIERHGWTNEPND